jgi:hypothetical protein
MLHASRTRIASCTRESQMKKTRPRRTANVAICLGTLAAFAGQASAVNISRYETDSASFGSSTWGGGHFASFRATYNDEIGPEPVLSMSALVRAWARLDGHHVTLGQASGALQATGDDATSGLTVQILGQTVYSATWEGGVDRTFSYPIFAVEEDVTVQTIFGPVTADVSAFGNAGVEIDTEASATGGSASFRPYAEATAIGSIGYGVPGARVGIYGLLTLARVELPTVASFQIDPGAGCVRTQLISQLIFRTLGGQLGAFVEIIGRMSFPFFTWNGVTGIRTLIAEAGCL